MTEQILPEDRPNGPVAAALLGGGLGTATLGVVTTLADVFKPVGAALNWWPPAGSLTGKSALAVAVFFMAWLILHFAFRGKDVNFVHASVWALILLGLGLLGTFPPFFEWLAGH